MVFLFGKNTKNQFALLIINHRAQTARTQDAKKRRRSVSRGGGGGGGDIRSKNIQFTP